MQYRPRIFLSTSLILVYFLYWGMPLFFVGIQAKIYPSEVNTFYKKGTKKKEIICGHKDNGKKVKLLQKKRFLPETLWCLVADNERPVLLHGGYINQSTVFNHRYITPVITDPLRGPPVRV